MGVIKTQISNLVRTTRFQNNPHQVTLNIERLEREITESFRSNTTKGPKQDSRNRLRSPYVLENNNWLTSLPLGIDNRRYFLLCYLDTVIFLLPKTFKLLFCLILRLSAYLMNDFSQEFVVCTAFDIYIFISIQHT